MVVDLAEEYTALLNLNHALRVETGFCAYAFEAEDGRMIMCAVLPEVAERWWESDDEEIDTSEAVRRRRYDISQVVHPR